MKISTTLFTVLLSTCVVYGQITWDKKTGPYGGRITDIEYHSPSGKFFALGGMTYTPYVSASGSVWSKLSFTGMPVGERAFEFFIDDLNHIYLLYYDGDLYRSTDAGVNFTLLNPTSKFISGTRMAKSIDGLFILGSTNTGTSVVWKSVNGGATWSQSYAASSGEKFNQILVNDQNQIFISTYAGDASVYRSDNGGSIFTKKMTGVAGGDQVNSFVKSPNGASLFILTQNAIYQSINDGDNWTTVTSTGLVNPGSNNGLLFCPSNTLLYLIENSLNDIYSRVLTGNPPQPTGTWATPSASFAKEVLSVAAVSANSFWVAQESGISRTTSCCASVAEVSDGLEELQMEDLLIANDGGILITSRNGLHRSATGSSWSKPNIGALSLFNGRLLKKPSTGELYLYGTGIGFAQKSSDHGVTWTAHTVPPANDIFSYQTLDGIKLLGVGQNSNKIHYSNNSGTGWQTGAGVTITGAIPGSYQIEDFDMDANFNLYLKIRNTSVSPQRDEIHKVVLSPNPTSGTPTTAVASRIDGTSGYTIGDLESRSLEVAGTTVYALGRDIGNTKHVMNFSSDAGVSWTAKDAAGGFDLAVASNGYIFITKSESNPYSFTQQISRNTGLFYTSTQAIPSSSHSGYVKTLLDDNGYAYALLDYTTLFKTNEIVITPNPPTGLTTVSKGATNVTLRWNDNSDIDDYYVIRKFNGTFYDSIGAVDVNTESFPQQVGYFELPGLLPNTPYQYEVAAVNAAGESTAAGISFTTLNTCAQSIPDNRSWSGLTQNQSGLGSLPGSNILIKKIAGNLYSITDISAGAIQPINGSALVPAQFFESCGETSLDFRGNDDLKPNGNGTWNGTNSLTLRWRTEASLVDEFDQITLTLNANDPVPVAPLNVAAYNYGNNTIEVSWKATGFEKTFTIERKTGAGGVYAVVGTVNYPEVSFVDNTGIAIGSTYFYRVKSTNGNAAPQSSPYSAEAQVTFQKPNFILSQTTVTSTVTNSLGYLWADFNKDGFDDLVQTQFDFFTPNKSAPIFFQNNGAGNFTVVNPGLTPASFGSGTTADYDNDGDLDLFYTIFGEPNRLYNGNGTFTFTKVDPTVVSEPGGAGFEGTQFASAWVDYDRDGLLDLFTPRTGGVNSYLFKQNSDHTFTKVTTAGDLVTLTMEAFGMTWGDYDNDGDQDVFVIDQDETKANKLFKNNGDGTFTKASSVFDSDIDPGSQTASWGDFDNDQDLDLFVGYSGGANFLFRNNGSGSFTKLLTGSFNFTGPEESVGSTWLDVNNDSFLDLFITGGEGNWFYINSNGSSFSRVIGEKIQDLNLSCLAVATSDYDNDGFVDIAISRSLLGDNQTGTPNHSLLFKNNNSNGNWLKVKLTGILSNKSAIGARIRITIGTQNQIREVTSHLGVGSQNSLTQHFGLGSATTVDNIQITWPSGLIQNVTNQNANQLIEVSENDGAFPVITYNAANHTSIVKGTATTFSPVATDNSSVVGVTLHYKKISTPAPYSTLAGTLNGTIVNQYDFAIPATFFDETGLEYFFTAIDESGNETRSPSGSETYKTYVIYPSADTKIPSERLGFGGQKANWKIISIPFELGSNNSVTTIFDELSSLDSKKDYRLITYKDEQNWAEFPTDFSSITRGTGYFINIRTPIDIVVGENLIAPPNTRANLFQVDLKVGWNMVGNPYLTTVSWADVATLNGLSGDAAEIVKYTGTSYAATEQTLEPWEGAFVFSDAAVADVNIPFLGQTSTGGRKGYKGLGSDINGDEWMVKLNLYQGERSYELGAIGMALDANTSYDNYDGVTPPRFFDYLEMNFSHPEHFAKRFTRDVVPTQNAYNWEFSVDANLDGETTLNWDNSAFSSAAKDIFLLDVSRQLLVNMKETMSYSFNPKESVNFKVFFGEDLRIAPERVQLGKAYPNPTSGTTMIAFSLPETGGMDQQVTLDIIDGVGRTAGTISQGRFNPGYHEVAFEAKELNAGFYAYRLTVQGKQGKTSHVNKLVIK